MTPLILPQLVYSSAQPVIVVGGGMRALTDLAQIPAAIREVALVVSANDHGFKIPELRVDYIVCKDHMHTELHKPMQEWLNVYNTPIITRQWWGDIRMVDWNLQNNSGLDALAVACLLSSGPVIPIGFDFFQEGTHWHEPDAPNVSRGRRMSAFTRRLAKLRERLGDQVCPISGPLTTWFEPLCEPLVYGYESEWAVKYAKTESRQLRARVAFPLAFDRRATVPREAVFMASRTEAEALSQAGLVEVLDKPSEF